MFTPHGLGMALVMMIATAICWGSWANTFKGVKNYRFELFYWDYAIGIFLVSVVLAFTMGSTGNDASSFLNNVHAADAENIVSVLIGGAVFNLANLLLVAAIDMAGLAIAFPVSIGIALVVGVITAYLQQPKGNAVLLAAGVACAVIAVVLDGRAYGTLGRGSDSNTGPAPRVSSRKSIVTCVVSGVLMGLWSPFVAHAMSHGNTLGPYSVAVFLTLGALLSCFIWNLYFMKKPLVGEPVNFGEFFRGPASGHVLGLLGGAIWGTGTVFNLVAANYTGVAISYAIGQSAPMVAALWGVFAWKEFAGAKPQAKTYLGLMFVFYLLAILLVAKANTAN
ncbi:MAG TPA: GRP family sugar transporter [Candidatus Bathyarchaeia archaeon]|nr:GRP family sugar transporter [Candidatus Bathyarchaeia archaeon]